MKTGATMDGAELAAHGAAARWVVWTGRVLTAIPVLLLLVSAAMKFARPPEVVESFTGHYGYPAGALLGIALAELASAVLLAIPRTAVLGAIMAAAYLGGAVATHVRAGEPFVTPILVGVLAWAGLYLRDARLRALLPLRS